MWHGYNGRRDTPSLHQGPLVLIREWLVAEVPVEKLDSEHGDIAANGARLEQDVLAHHVQLHLHNVEASSVAVDTVIDTLRDQLAVLDLVHPHLPSFRFSRRVKFFKP